VIKDAENGLLIGLKISPNASKNEFIISRDEIKVKITAQPIDGKANKALIEFLSKSFKVPKTYFEIVKGETSKEKTILIKNIDSEKILKIKNVLNIK